MHMMDEVYRSEDNDEHCAINCSVGLLVEATGERLNWQNIVAPEDLALYEKTRLAYGNLESAFVSSACHMLQTHGVSEVKTTAQGLFLASRISLHMRKHLASSVPCTSSSRTAPQMQQRLLSLSLG